MQRKHTRRSSHAPQEAARPRKGQRSAPAPETAVLQCLRRAGRPLRLDEVTESLGPVAGADAAAQLAQPTLRAPPSEGRSTASPRQTKAVSPAAPQRTP